MDFKVSEALGRRSISGFSLLCLVGLVVVLPQGWISAWAWERGVRALYLLLIAFFVSTLLIPVSMRAAARFGVMDHPSARKVHKVATPRLGGIAVYGAFVLTLLRNNQWETPIFALVAGGTLIFAMGVWDDARGLSAGIRLLGQLAAAVVVLAGGVRLHCLPSALPWQKPLEMAVTAFWMIGITNAFNFLDGIDGLASGMGALCSVLFLAIAWPGQYRALIFASSAVAGACLGFLPYNWEPARVFLGDGGSTFIGFLLAGLAVRCSQNDQLPLVSLSTPLLILSIPIFDMIYTTLSRVRRGAVRSFKEWIEYTGKDHFHHRLIHLGMSAPGAVQFILLTNLCIGLGALVIRHTYSRLASALLLAQTFLFFVVIVVLMLLGREITSD